MGWTTVMVIRTSHIKQLTVAWVCNAWSVVGHVILI